MDPQRFDDLARRMAMSTTRRSVLRATAGGAIGALLSRLGVKAATTGPCPSGANACGGVCCSACETCEQGPKGQKARCESACPNGATCANGQCECPGGGVLCGSGNKAACCGNGATCVNGQCQCPPGTSTCKMQGRAPGGKGDTLTVVSCCAACEKCVKPDGCVMACPGVQVCGSGGQCACPDGQPSCGTGPNVVCCDGVCANGVCTCASGKPPCGGDCCDACEACRQGPKGQKARCESACPNGTTCEGGQCLCPDGQALCGGGPNAACCEDGAVCVNGQCQCPPSTAACPEKRQVAGRGVLNVVGCCAACERCDPWDGCVSVCRGVEVCGPEGRCECPDGGTPCGGGSGAVCCDGVCNNGACTCASGDPPCGEVCCSACETCLGQGAKAWCKPTCPKGTECAGGQCVCPDGQPACGSGHNAGCCEDGATCVNGKCGCPQGSSPCQTRRKVGSGKSAEELNVITCCAGCERCVPNGQGGCVSECPGVQVCGAGGQCECPDGRPPCHGVCCGACQVCGVSGCEACDPASACVDGLCTCAPGEETCGSGCCDPAKGQSCANGVCRCPDGTLPCQGDCCDALTCQVCGPNGCESGCAGPCNVCDTGQCTPIECPDDGNPCTANVCDPDWDGCVADPIPDCCVTDDECPDDGNPCARLVCDSETNRCIPEPLTDGVECDDGEPCTGPGACQDGQCQPGASLCGSCQTCTAAGCEPIPDGDACLGDGTCCGGDCLPACPSPLVRAADCSCACPEITCSPGYALDSSVCACCRTVCNAGDCGMVPDECGGTFDCGPCVTCGACTPIDQGCTTDEECCSGLCEGGICSYVNSPDGYCYADGEPCPSEPRFECCRACVDGCCGCRSLGETCSDQRDCCDEGSGCLGFQTGICCLQSGDPIAQPCTSDGQCCSGKCEGGFCACAGLGERCDFAMIRCCGEGFETWCTFDDSKGYDTCQPL